MASFINEIVLTKDETIEMTIQYQNIDKILMELCKDFEKSLTKNQVDEFRKICNTQSELQAAAEEEYFKKGFKSGLKIAAETFMDK